MIQIDKGAYAHQQGKPITPIPINNSEQIIGYQFKEIESINAIAEINTNIKKDNKDKIIKITWLDYLPIALSQKLKKRKHKNKVGINRIQLIVNQSLQVQDLLIQEPKLFWLLISYAKQQGWNKQRIINVCQKSPLKILKSCGLPDREETLTCLQKIDYTNYSSFNLRGSPTLFQLTYALLKLDVSQLIKRKAIYLSMVEFLYQHPELIDARFIKRNKSKHINLFLKVRDLKRMALAIDYPKIHRLLIRCRHLKDIKQAITRLQVQISDEIIRQLQQLDDISSYPEELLRPYLNNLENDDAKNDWTTPYPQSPIASDPNIIPLTNYRAVFIEAHTQHNCLAEYHYDLTAGEYFAYQILQPERATLTLQIKLDTKTLQIDDLKLKDNRPVSKKTRSKVNKWLKKANKRLKQSARDQLQEENPNRANNNQN